VELKGHENRKLERYGVRDGAMAVIGKNANVLGQIIDISRGGLSFRYMDNGMIEDQEDLLTILSTDQQFYLVNIPFQTVSDFALVNIPTFSSIIMRRRGVRFRDLDEEQARRLEEFIRRYASEKHWRNSDVSGNAVSM
jgi:c-di-GMP-binding flagellar brake protein YcgR